MTGHSVHSFLAFLSCRLFGSRDHGFSRCLVQLLVHLVLKRGHFDYQRMACWKRAVPVVATSQRLWRLMIVFLLARKIQLVLPRQAQIFLSVRSSSWRHYVLSGPSETFEKNAMLFYTVYCDEEPEHEWVCWDVCHCTATTSTTVPGPGTPPPGPQPQPRLRPRQPRGSPLLLL